MHACENTLERASRGHKYLKSIETGLKCVNLQSFLKCLRKLKKILKLCKNF